MKNMEYCPTARRMKDACPILKPGKLTCEFSNLEAEMDAISKLLVKCSNDYTVNGDADGLKYISEIYAVKTFLPKPASYRNLIETNCTNSLYELACPQFYEFEMIKVVDGTISFKSLFSLEATEESVEKFVVLQVGQRAALILVSLARIAIVQSRVYTALACCRVGLILVRLLNSISSRTLWMTHQVLFFLLAAEALEACAFLAAFDHLSCCQCSQIMDKAVFVYQGFLNIFRSYGARLTKTGEDPMLTDVENLADIGSICEKLEVELQFNEFIGNSLQLQLSMIYFHLAIKEVTAYKSAQPLSLPAINPRDFYVELCVEGFEELVDSYMMAAALFCRGCFHSASGQKEPNRRSTKQLKAAESDFLNVLNMAKDDPLLLSSIPWQRLIEKASLASLVTQCRILVRCATSSDVEHLRSSLDHLYSLVKWRSSSEPDSGSPLSWHFSTLACLAFLYLTDHIRGAVDVLNDSEKSSMSLRRAKCASLAFRLLKDEATLSYCLKVFCDLSKEGPCGGEVSTDWESRLRRCLLRLQLLSVPIFAAANPLLSLTKANNVNTTVAVSSNNMRIVPFSESKRNGLQSHGPCRDNCEFEDTASSSSTSGSIQCHNRISKMQLVSDEEDNSPQKMLDKLHTLNYELSKGSFSAVNSQIDMFSLKMGNHVLTDVVESSNYESHFEKENSYCSMKFTSTINRASQNSEIDSYPEENTLSHATYEGSSPSKTDHYVEVDETLRTLSGHQKENCQSFNWKADSVIDAALHENLTNFSKSLQCDLATSRAHSNRATQFRNFTRNNPAEYASIKDCYPIPNRGVADDITNGSQKIVNESFKIDHLASPCLSECSRSIIKTPKFSVQVESSNIVAPVACVALEDYETTQLDERFDSLLHRKPVFPKINVLSNPSMDGGITFTANAVWVAVFPPNSSSSEESENNSFSESLPAASQEVQQSSAKQLSRNVPKSSVPLQENLFAGENGVLPPVLEEHPVSKNRDQLVQEGVDKIKFKRVSRNLSADTDSWQVFLRRSSLLQTVEDKLEDLFFIDGSDDLLCLKNIIIKDLQSLCCAIDANRDNSCPDYLRTHANCAYIAALQPLGRVLGVAEFYSLLMTICDALDKDLFGSAALWT